MTVGYCKKCAQNTLLKREEMDICLAIILAIFTAGIGLIVYLIIWYNKDENQCVHCGTVATPASAQPASIEENSLYNYQQAINEQLNPYRTTQQKGEATPEMSYTKVIGEKVLYCSFCGVKLDNNAEYCPDCGMKI
jgi:hypothetical protein